MIIKGLDQKQNEKRNEWITEITSMIAGGAGNALGLEVTEVPLEEDLIELFKGNKESVATCFVALHDFFKVEQQYPTFEEFTRFDTLKDFGTYLSYYVLKREGLLSEDELMTPEEEELELY